MAPEAVNRAGKIDSTMLSLSGCRKREEKHSVQTPEGEFGKPVRGRRAPQGSLPGLGQSQENEAPTDRRD